MFPLLAAIIICLCGLGCWPLTSRVCCGRIMLFVRPIVLPILLFWVLVSATS